MLGEKWKTQRTKQLFILVLQFCLRYNSPNPILSFFYFCNESGPFKRMQLSSHGPLGVGPALPCPNEGRMSPLTLPNPQTLHSRLVGCQMFFKNQSFFLHWMDHKSKTSLFFFSHVVYAFVSVNPLLKWFSGVLSRG